MTKAFIQRVLRELIVDTRKYRYTCKEEYRVHGVVCSIWRLPLYKLDTTAAISDWEHVYTIK